MKEFIKDALTIWDQSPLRAASTDFAIPIFNQFNECNFDAMQMLGPNGLGDKCVHLYREADYEYAKKKIAAGDVKMVTSHIWNFNALTQDFLGKNVNMLLNYRHPINSLLSEMTIPWISLGFGKEFLFERHINRGNLFIRKLLLRHFVIAGEITDEFYQKAIDIVENNYFLVILAEYFAESLFLLSKHFGFDVSLIDYVNEFYSPNPLRQSDLSKEYLQILKKENSYDIMFYDHFKNILLKKIDDLTEPQKIEMKEFKERNDVFAKKQKLAATLLKTSVIASGEKPYFTRKTDDYLDNKYPGFFKILEEYKSKTNEQPLRRYYFGHLNSHAITNCEAEYIGKRLGYNTECVILGTGKTAYELARAIEILNKTKNANISLLYVLEDAESITKNKMRGIPVFPIKKELLFKRKLLIADFRRYYQIRHKLLEIGVLWDDIVDWLDEFKQTRLPRNKVFNISGYRSRDVGRILAQGKGIDVYGNPFKGIALNFEALKNIMHDNESAFLLLVNTLYSQGNNIVFTRQNYDNIRLDRQVFANYFEVHIKTGNASGDNVLRGNMESNPDLVIENSEDYTANELAFIIMIESTDFCSRLRYNSARKH